MKASCQRKIDTIIENHKDFSRVVLSKMHAAKRAWNEAFDREIQQADTFLEKKISVDYRVRDLKETIQILDNTQIAHHVKNHAYSWTFRGLFKVLKFTSKKSTKSPPNAHIVVVFKV